ncbi:MAG TPA: porin family protein [Ohtaekwangia sp.]|nr:porin family protein [Ohtaekwangia sp.]
MKKISSPLLIIVVLCSALTATAQSRVKAGIKFGANSSIMSASFNTDASARWGFHVGGFLEFKVSDNFYFQPEVYYSQQGQKDTYYELPNGPDVGETTTKLDYLNFPFLAKFPLGKVVNLQVGPQFGFMVKGREEGTVDGAIVDEDLKDVFKSLDVAMVAGVGLRMSEHFQAGIRLNLGVTDVLKNDSDDYPAVKSRTFHFYLGYSF